MSFLAPGFLLAAALASLVVIGLHLLSTHDPKLEPLPTARFVPEVLVRATATTVRPTDLWLLLLRVALVLLFGAALARPVVTPPHSPVARIVAVDVSRAVGRPAEVADSSRRYLAGAATVILFDSTARVVSRGAADSLAALTSKSAPASKSSPASTLTPPPARQGSLSAALVAALRAAALLREGADSLELVVVSPFAVEEQDAATDALRALWPGRLTTVVVTPAVAKPQGSVEVQWADSTARALWKRRDTPDTISGLRGSEAVLIYPFVRQWRAAAPLDTLTRVYASWIDGEPAALERATAIGCTRSLGFALPAEGDAVLRPEFQRFIGALAAPCGGPRDYAPVSTAAMTRLRGAGPLAPSNAVAPRIERATPLMFWLLILAAILAILELLVRRRPGHSEALPLGGTRPLASEPTGRVA